MTDTTVDIELVASCSEMKVNRVLTELYYDAMTQVPTPTYTPEELDFAKQITEEAGLVNDGTLFSGAGSDRYRHRRFTGQPHSSADHLKCRYDV